MNLVEPHSIGDLPLLGMSELASIDKKIPILIVDDFGAMRRIMRGALQKLGFENVTEAEDGSAALEKLKSEEFKLVISDWVMPNLMGIDLLKEMRSLKGLKALPFIMVIMETQRGVLGQAEEAGANAHIVKPFTAEQLKQKLTQVL